jgi:hypothetical protein
VADAARIADRNRTEFYRLLQKHELTPAKVKMFRNVKAVLVRLAEGRSAEMVGRDIHRWKHRQVFDREQMEEILVAKLIGTHNRTIAGMILPRKSSPLSGASTTSEMVGPLEEVGVGRALE